MFQIVQNLKTGATTLEEIPAPQLRPGTLLIRTTRSLVSLGTEKMLVEFGKANLLEKARQQPERVRMVLDKIKTDGLIPTVKAVFNKLDEPLPLGYCNVGVVAGTGVGVTRFKVGDRVASNGPHASFVCVPENLAAHIPDSVSDEAAAFTVVGAIGLQGIRLIEPTLGETVVVYGLGLIGLLSAQILIANGCKVIGIDLDTEKLALASRWGIIPVHPEQGDLNNIVLQHTGGRGADAVLITASAKKDNIVEQSARMSRKRGRIVLVGVVDLQLNRADFFEKELRFQVSCSYGPGRYDERYEQKGQDYPPGFVRWTEQRNFEAVLQLLASGKLDAETLITERVPLQEYQKIYNTIGQSRAIASILEYPQAGLEVPVQRIDLQTPFFSGKTDTIGIIGAGNFTKMTLLPALKGNGACVKYLASASGLSGTLLAKKYGVAVSTTDYHNILADPEVALVMITTRHNLHTQMTVSALEAGKHVFVEKPLAIEPEGLEAVLTAAQRSGRSVTVGFNRRFSPHIQKLKSLLGPEPGPMQLILTMNAGFIPSNSWVQDPAVGGGRIIGEACHLIDLAVFLSGSKVVWVFMQALGDHPSESTDNASLLLKMENGSSVVINYFSNGHKAYSKERIELFHQGRTAIMDNYRLTEGFGFSNFSRLKTRQDKGHTAQFKLLIERLRNGGAPLIPFDEIVNVTRASFAAIESLKKSVLIQI